jgi:hypothetical protein
MPMRFDRPSKSFTGADKRIAISKEEFVAAGSLHALRLQS